jgi:alpha-1,3-rhamnosyltransferase
MPSYNHELYVRDAIESVLAQTYQNFELIIIDDGSTDKSWEKITAYADETRVKLYRRQNKGLISTIEELRGMATGKYLSILASDDMFHSDKLKLMVGLLELHPKAAMCIGKTRIIDQHGNHKRRVRSEFDGKGHLFERLIAGTTYVSSVSTLIRTNLYQCVEFIDPFIEDLPAWLQIAECREIVCTPYDVAYYRKIAGSMSTDIHRMISAEKNILSKFLKQQPHVQPVFPIRWRARWFKALASGHKADAIKHVFSRNFSIKLLGCLDFYIGAAKLVLKW